MQKEGRKLNEFVIRLPIEAAEVVGRMIKKGYAAGLPLSRYYERPNDLLVAVTEKRTKEELLGYAIALEACLA